MLPVTLREIAQAAEGQLERLDGDCVVASLSTDSRTIQEGDLYWALPGENFDGHDYCREALAKGALGVVIQNNKLPGIEIPCVRVPDTLYALGELARLLRNKTSARVVGITGSVGKTSTKEFIRHAVGRVMKTKATEGNYNNLVGLPKTLMNVEPDDQWLVLELGTDRPGEMKRLVEIAQPQAGVVTAISEAHLERMGSIEGVFREKSELLKGLPPDGKAVIPQGSRFREDLAAVTEAGVITFGTEKGSEYHAVDPTLRTSGCYGFMLETPAGKGEVALQVPGLHQVYAATAAAAAAVSSGLSLESVIEGLQTFSGLPGRCQIINLAGSITLIADHYNANPVSMAAAQRLLETFLERRKVFVAGEMWDLGKRSPELHEMVGNTIGSGNVDLLVAVGPLTRHLVLGARNAGLSNQCIRWFENIDTASKELIRLLEPSDVVLVKGSRGMKMEGILEALTRHFG
ncbi:MAG: UDP-N-acetylmuramoyl-tripeptide--D-alanyl-D-alanine ligase [Candidatus Omnitrophica bacterium]|nr:UDP-N-acetylmuramoyl-tripeptide--D-alanyl-D-alanine ligase [bacterium]MBV6483207.1 UDP-N-acetylmuramoyl-tripeptide--D-alanyl-D-alanine ligase [bacterium]MCC6731725.1 UDP-N-acetylmuramoyl-tripeptide--D-alanyl-D-alanine ligase [Candidatus Omnitrophota bacterium]MCE7907333.1 UDP-N-acetylmuramoyl-tripeptide--D-alanyl-D-alanine ligase [Candidatus Omnitrophica bacterium COP1]MCL4733882.1 UDP-N-acetylmuramoyl-tripeptide--D-alanyl-D-alanine ligase [Candidatus Omnitrophota bacterium]